MFLFLIVLNSLMAHFMVENYIPPNEFERMESAIGRVFSPYIYLAGWN